MSVFQRIFGVVVGEEGGYTANPSDRGNWTGGAQGRGILRGTKYGISAASYPDLDIEGLTLADAQRIYQDDYYEKICGDQLPAPLALILFDCAVNSGVTKAIRWLQRALKVAGDGVIGPETLAAVKAYPAPSWTLCAEIIALRTAFLGGTAEWETFGLGWSRRLAALPYRAMQLVTA